MPSLIVKNHQKELRFIFDVCLGKKPQVGTDFNWQDLLKICGEEGLLALFYLKLKESGSLDMVSENAKKSLENEYYVLAARNSVFFQTGQEIVLKFRESGIKVLPLKGFFLNENVYDNIAARPIADIDILVTKADLGSVDRLLAESGWKACNEWRDFSSRPLSINSCVYLKPEGQYWVVLHLHWHLINLSWPMADICQAVDMDKVWLRASQSSLAAQDQFSHLVFHGVSHQFRRMILAVDIIKCLELYQGQVEFSRELFSLKELAGWADYGLGICSYVGAEPGSFKKIADEESIAYKKGLKGKRSYWLPLSILLAAKKDVFAVVSFIWEFFIPKKEVLAQGLRVKPSQVRIGHYLNRLFGGIE
jgi:hypothetical protein